MKRWLPAVALLVVLAAGGGMLAVVALLMSVATGLSGDTGSAQVAFGSDCGQPTPGNLTVFETDEMRENAQIIVAVGRKLKVPERGLIVALATARQESTLRNLDYGDRDSVGLFQQRANWGTVAQRTNPETSATLFFTGGTDADGWSEAGLLDIEGWQLMTVAGAAQEVQRSAFPDAYAQWEAVATTAVQQILGGGPVQECTVEEAPVAGSCAASSDLSGYPNGQIPESALCELDFAKGHRLRSDAALAAERLSVAYQKRWGRPMCVTDSYRSLPEQIDVRRRKGSMAAVPGTSKHGLGRALDLCDSVNDDASPQWAWMRANAPRYGWDNPPWALKGGTGPYEPWHFSYGGD